MSLLQSQRIPIGHPPSDIIHDVYQTIRGLHLKGHGWHMWDNASDGGAQIVAGTSMRKYVKSWVTQWDSIRFYPGEDSETETSSWQPSALDRTDFHEEDDRDHAETCSAAGTLASSEETDMVAPGRPSEPTPSAPSAF
jgi:hypothetical protein